MTFEFLKVQTAMDSIDIDDIGNVCLRCSNDDCREWFLKIKAELGWCEIREYGPLEIDSEVVDFSFSFYYNKFEFNEKKLYKIINDFLNNPKKSITCVDIISEDEFSNRLGEIKNVW